jgi:hypothetical protein
MPPGTAIAPPTVPMARDDTTVNPIANAPRIEAPVDSSVPNEYQFEIYRLRRRVDELECIVKDRDERLVRAISIIEDELQFWRTGLHQHVWETTGAVTRRVLRLESVMSYIKEAGAHFWPALDIPERWRK